MDGSIDVRDGWYVNFEGDPWLTDLSGILSHKDSIEYRNNITGAIIKTLESDLESDGAVCKSIQALVGSSLSSLLVLDNDGNLCGEHGVCIVDGGNHTCNCSDGWIGATCDHATGCDSNPDCGHGNCTADGGSHTCNCSDGWIGAACDLGTGCDSNPDCGHGNCTADGGSHTCNCSDGWIGAACDHATGCDSNPDCGHGSCMAYGGNYTCVCAAGYSGADCEHATGCDSNPDCGHGACTAHGENHTCTCSAGWSGDTCDHATGCDVPSLFVGPVGGRVGSLVEEPKLADLNQHMGQIVLDIGDKEVQLSCAFCAISISAVKCQQIQLGSLQIDAKKTSGQDVNVTINASNLAIKCSCSWMMRWMEMDNWRPESWEGTATAWASAEMGNSLNTTIRLHSENLATTLPTVVPEPSPCTLHHLHNLVPRPVGSDENGLVAAGGEVTVTSGPTNCTEQIKPGDELSMYYALKIAVTSTAGTPGADVEQDMAPGPTFNFTVGAGEVMVGWDEGLIGLCQGAKATLILPPSMAYGGEIWSSGKILPGASLQLDVEIVTVKADSACESTPCWNGGTCSESAPCVGCVGTQFCKCVAGFFGRFCETNENDCFVNNVTCDPGQSCVPCARYVKGVPNAECSNGYTCETSTAQIGEGDGWYVNLDELGWYVNLAGHTEDLFKYRNNIAGAITKALESDGAVCKSIQTLVGSSLSSLLDSDGNLCGEHGTCVADGGNHTCNCSDGWSGAICDHATGCDSNPDCGHGNCTADGGSYTCNCSDGWRGTACDLGTGCDGKPCGHGNCTADGGTYTCTCVSGWNGADCSHATGCDSNPCKHHATCTASGGDHTCACVGAWTGDDCGETGQCCSTLNIANCSEHKSCDYGVAGSDDDDDCVLPDNTYCNCYSYTADSCGDGCPRSCGCTGRGAKGC
eukprot:SAG25_NODE_1347_length_3245_cov_61.242530_1_plen_920_part_00